MSLTFRYTLLLPLLIVLVQGERISQTKCSEFRNKTRVARKVLGLLPGQPTTVYHSLCTIESLILTKPDQFPHIALLGWSQPDSPGEIEFNCEGSLISERFVLTVAHCGLIGDPDIVRLGKFNDQPSDTHVDVAIESVVKHPDNKFRDSYHDIGLIKLKQDVGFSKWIRPACLWTDSGINPPSVSVKNGGIKQAVKILNRTACDPAFNHMRPFPRGVEAGQLCVDHGDVRDSCEIDSGSPLQALDQPQVGCMHHIVGLVTVTLCNDPQAPAVYTQVASYIDWIETIVWG